MELAILVFFFAIFGGILFLVLMIWFFLRRRSGPRSFASNHRNNAGTIYGAGSGIHQTDDGLDHDPNWGPSFSEENAEGQARETVKAQIFEASSAESAAAPPAEPAYYESSYDAGASYDSSSSYDSGSSFDSSSSSDSGSSSSSD